MVTTFCIVNIPVIGRDLQLPYVAASVGARRRRHLDLLAVQECKPEDVRMGMRVEAVWKPDGERTGSFDDVLYFSRPASPMRRRVVHPSAVRRFTAETRTTRRIGLDVVSASLRLRGEGFDS